MSTSAIFNWVKGDDFWMALYSIQLSSQSAWASSINCISGQVIPYFSAWEMGSSQSFFRYTGFSTDCWITPGSSFLLEMRTKGRGNHAIGHIFLQHFWFNISCSNDRSGAGKPRGTSPIPAYPANTHSRLYTWYITCCNFMDARSHLNRDNCIPTHLSMDGGGREHAGEKHNYCLYPAYLPQDKI